MRHVGRSQLSICGAFPGLRAGPGGTPKSVCPGLYKKAATSLALTRDSQSFLEYGGLSALQQEYNLSSGKLCPLVSTTRHTAQCGDTTNSRPGWAAGHKRNTGECILTRRAGDASLRVALQRCHALKRTRARPLVHAVVRSEVVGDEVETSSGKHQGRPAVLPVLPLSRLPLLQRLCTAGGFRVRMRVRVRG